VQRILVTLLVVAAAGAGGFLLFAAGSDGAERGTYSVELDNAFGLIQGADVKVAGVRAGKISSLSLDRTDMRARVGIELTQPGFQELRTDAFCESRPQSLIGEYFLDCRPGQRGRRLRAGEVLPVERTGSTVPIDLVNNIMRRPYRERFSILLSELGAGLAARGDDLNETIRRANPALRETDKVLALLRDQRRTIRDLNVDAERVLSRLANRRTDVSRFVTEARDTARTSASRADSIRGQFQRFPTFLRELRPTLRLLGEAADRQVPALRSLDRASGDLETFLDTLGPFSEASRPALRTLAGAADQGRDAVEASTPQIAELRRGVDVLPELSSNLAITLEHLDDPKFRTEPDERAGRGKDGGYTGLESLLRYVFAQSQAINLYDSNSYVLKVNAFLDRACANYADVSDVKDGTSPERCRAWMGPNQPGITSEDPTKGSSADAPAARRTRDDRERDRPRSEDRPAAPAAPSGGDGGGGAAPSAPESGGGADRPAPSITDRLPRVPEPPVRLPDLDDILPGAPQVPQAPTPTVPDAAPDLRRSEDVLDFLLG